MRNFLTYTIVTAIALTIGWAFMEVREFVYNKTVLPKVEEQEWCLIQVMPTAGGQIVTQQGGSHTYRMMATTNGYEVYQKCDEIPNAYGDNI